MIIFNSTHEKELKAEVILRYSKGDFGIDKQPTIKPPFLKEALTKSNLIDIFIRTKNIIL
jgi:hypothetical protein